MTPCPNLVKSIVLLARPALSLFVSFSALSVYFYFQRAIVPEALFLLTGVFLLSCAASAINQIQEREIDCRMERTKTRPLPLKLLEVRYTTLFSIITGVFGLSLLFFGARPLAAFIGAIAVFVYNGVYTPLKTRTSLALIPGAIAGALPVFIGCAAATGRIDEKAIVMAFFMFLWQVPHFLLLLLRFEDDYRRVGVSTLFLRISQEQLRIIIYIWVLAASGTTSLFPIMGILTSLPLLSAIACLNIWIFIKIVKAFRGKKVFLLGRILYVYQSIVFIVLAIQGFLENNT